MGNISKILTTTVFYAGVLVSSVFCQSSVPSQSKTETPKTPECCEPQTVKIWNGVAPGSENWTQKEKVIENTPVGTVVLNVVTPTLTAYLPEKSKATGTGVIIAPGGYCVALAISQEGDAARGKEFDRL